MPVVNLRNLLYLFIKVSHRISFKGEVTFFTIYTKIEYMAM